jgi:Mg2+-importing ATPase
MISTGIASLFLPFLPMLPSQLLLNNLLYDVSEMTIPTDNVDPELLQRPAHWDMDLVRRFLLVFGPINSLFDFAIFAVMLFVFHADQTMFRSGFFIENFLTQTLVIFAIRTRRVPFFRSRPSIPLTATTLLVAAIGTALPFTPLASVFGFTALPPLLFGVLMLIIMTVYFTLVEIAKVFFYRSLDSAQVQPREDFVHRLERIVARFRHHPPARTAQHSQDLTP